MKGKTTITIVTLTFSPWIDGYMVGYKIVAVTNTNKKQTKKSDNNTSIILKRTKRHMYAWVSMP